MTDDYWTRFWTEHGQSSAQHDPQSRVLRTLNQEPISEINWHETLEYIAGKLSLEPDHRVLDLCGGNGLIARRLATQCRNVVVVDISDGLLDAIDDCGGNVTGIHGDMREIEFDDASFDRILCYAAIQYLTLAEAVSLLTRIYKWLAPGGVLFIGDIPDANLQWTFFNTPERRSSYFEKLQAGEPIVGTWFDRDWLTHLSAHCGFADAEVYEQPENQIYSWFRFDMACQK